MWGGGTGRRKEKPVGKAWEQIFEDRSYMQEPENLGKKYPAIQKNKKKGGEKRGRGRPQNKSRTERQRPLQTA